MKAQSKKSGIKLSTTLLFVFFLSLLLFGLNVKEPQRVMEQAWNICLECIGIG